MQKILIVRVSSLGDVVHTMPVIADIHRHDPAAQVDWLVEEAFVDLVQLVAGVRRVIPFALRRWRKRLLRPSTWREVCALRRALANEAYDAIIDCQGLLKTAWIAHWARKREGGFGILSGLGNRTDGASYEWPVRFFYDRCIAIAPRTHVVERSRRLVAAALHGPNARPISDDIDFGLDTRMAATALAQSGFNPGAPYVVLVHATSRADKQWPESLWIKLGHLCARRGIALVLPWGHQNERIASERIAAHITQDASARAWVPPQLTLPAVVGLIDGAVATVGVDTGLVHIAAALKRPTVELYNFDTAWRTGGDGSPHVRHLGGVQPAQLADVCDALVGLGVL